MLQSTAFDPVLGIDVHMVVPAPPAPPTPVPVPMPFVGLVFDPMSLAVGAAISLATRGGPGLVLVNGLPATNCMTSVTNALTMPHLAAPAIMFARNGLPQLDGDAELFFGSKDISIGGAYGVRLGDIALGCSDPVRLPTGVVLALPKGRPVLNMAPMAPDLAAMAITGAMKGAIAGLAALARRGARLLRQTREHSRFAERLSQRLGGCHPPANASRWRTQWHRGVRFVTGHPVDVVTGGVFTEVVDLELPGPIPLRIERVYESAGSAKRSSLGHGWNHSLDESLWFERGRAVVRLGDGREIEFGLWDLPDRRMRPGDVVGRLIHKVKLTCVGPMHFELRFDDGRVHEFAAILGGDERSKLVKIYSPDRCHHVELRYDESGRLEHVIDSCGRTIGFVHDERGRLCQLLAPHPSGEGQSVHRRYRYDEHDDPVEVIDALGHAWRYDYRGHLLVQETDRTGLSFYFQYDGVGSIARCVRTWGDGGIYDHVIHYDPRNRKTFVENSHREVTIYSYDARNQVTAVIDPLGYTTRYDYDLECGEQTQAVDPLGGKTLRRYEHGDLVQHVAADGAITTTRYDAHRPVHELDARGGEWTWTYDTLGRLVQVVSPAGRRVRRRWQAGMLAAVVRGEGHETRLSYDANQQVEDITLADGSQWSRRHDGRGRVIEERAPLGGVTRFGWDLEDRLTRVLGPAGVEYSLTYDAEGELIELRGDGRWQRFEYAHNHRLVALHEAGTTRRWEWDREGRLRALVNEAGERFVVERDPAGRVIAETGFDGRTRRFTLDAAGRPVSTRLAGGRTSSSRHDPVGRLVELRHDDGSFTQLEYDGGGLLRAAENETVRVEIERDADGYVTCERSGSEEVRSNFDALGDRVALHSTAGARVTIERTSLGEPLRMYFGQLGLVPDVRLAHDLEGNLRSIRHASGMEFAWTHDRAGRPTTRRILAHRHGGGIDLLDRLDHHWRSDEQLARIGDRELSYDARGRLVGDLLGDVRRDRSFDAVGNVHRTVDHGDRRHGPGGRIEEIEGHAVVHDEDGNLIRRATTEGGWVYRWNGHGLLAAIVRPDGARAEFEYDAFARRVGRRLRSPAGVIVRETKFVWDGDFVVDELDSLAGHTTWHWLPDGFAPIAKEHAGRRFAIASDLLGTPTHLFDEGGRVCFRAQLDLFGQIEVEIGERSDCPWRRPGQYDDGFGDELYHRYRWYSPTFGAYVSLDPAGVEAGWHGYADVPDPLLWLDLLGLMGAYLFKMKGGGMYIGKGPEKRFEVSKRQRAGGEAIVQEAHIPCDNDRIGLMVEARVMDHYGFGRPRGSKLLNKIHSPGKKYLETATKAERRLVADQATELIRMFEASEIAGNGKKC